MEYMATLESDKDAEGKTVSGSLKAKYVAYIQSMGLTSSQQKAMWLALKNSTWSDKGTPWERESQTLGKVEKNAGPGRNPGPASVRIEETATAGATFPPRAGVSEGR